MLIEGNPRFETTCWSVVLAAGSNSDRAEEALATLCKTYWFPVYTFIRRWGHTPDDAADLTQGFFTELLRRNDFQSIDPSRGRFRSFLLACCRNYLCKDRRHKAVRGPAPFSIDAIDAERRYTIEPTDTLTPEQIFDRRWALSILEGALNALRDDYHRSGKTELFDRLEPTLAGESLPGGFLAVAESLGMSEGAVQVAAHRLRKRYRDAIRALIAATVDDPATVDEELRDLFTALVPVDSRIAR
ncbi:RNA polymerase sigma factor [Tautonia marina]|uniref:RNA polymerase sigma factor n=1 Tax=Tautonia marina TaxID=2653855 RepID=UPI001260AAD8|nr:sigma-70 family RNA polymerase sigma factor [Tautonia marina]